MNQLVTRARVLLTDLSYQMVVTQDLQGKVEAEFGNTMLLRKLTGVDTNPVNGLKENNMGETNISQTNRATLGKNEHGETRYGVKLKNKKLAGTDTNPANNNRQNQEKGRNVTFRDHGPKIVQNQVIGQVQGKIEQERAGKIVLPKCFEMLT